MDDIPTQVRVRTDPDDGYGHRYDVIQAAKDTFDAGNNTEAIVKACDLTGRLLPTLEEVLADADIRPSEKEKIADAVSTRHISMDIEREDVTIRTEETEF